MMLGEKTDLSVLIKTILCYTVENVSINESGELA
jgi:hypothetical protein